MHRSAIFTFAALCGAVSLVACTGKSPSAPTPAVQPAALTVHAAAPEAASRTVAALHVFPFGAELPGSTTLTRTDSGISMTVHAVGLTANNAYTVWFVIFNNPERRNAMRFEGARVETMARRASLLAPDLDAHRTLAALNKVVFEQANLRGNREDYYDPRNSFLNDVLDRGLGIPITLSIIYMEVAKRVGLPLAGVGMPGHFLLKHYGHDGNEMLIDCFNRGDILS